MVPNLVFKIDPQRLRPLSPELHAGVLVFQGRRVHIAEALNPLRQRRAVLKDAAAKARGSEGALPRSKHRNVQSRSFLSHCHSTHSQLLLNTEFRLQEVVIQESLNL